MHNARIEPATDLETAIGEYFEHIPVVGEHVGFELGDPARPRDESEMFQQQRADTQRHAREAMADREDGGDLRPIDLQMG